MDNSHVLYALPTIYSLIRKDKLDFAEAGNLYTYVLEVL